jgi:hypothetical protein
MDALVNHLLRDLFEAYLPGDSIEVNGSMFWILSTLGWKLLSLMLPLRKTYLALDHQRTSRRFITEKPTLIEIEGAVLAAWFAEKRKRRKKAPGVTRNADSRAETPLSVRTTGRDVECFSLNRILMPTTWIQSKLSIPMLRRVRTSPRIVSDHQMLRMTSNFS